MIMGKDCGYLSAQLLLVEVPVLIQFSFALFSFVLLKLGVCHKHFSDCEQLIVCGSEWNFRTSPVLSAVTVRSLCLPFLAFSNAKSLYTAESCVILVCRVTTLSRLSQYDSKQSSRIVGAWRYGTR